MKQKALLCLTILVVLFFTANVSYAATLSLSPASQSVNVGDIFSVNIILDTQGQAVDGVDINALHFDPSILQVQGSQISAGSLMSETVANSVDSATGKIVFSQIPNSNATYNGNGTLASVSFKALTAGTANVTFDFSSGSTLDSNVASNGFDILSAVINGVYVSSAVSQENSQASNSGSTGTSGNTSGSSSGSGSATTGGGGQTVQVSAGNSSQNCSSSPQKLTRNLYRSLKGDDVKILQNFLISQNLLSSDSNTGFFGALTEKAVQSFQKSQSIVSSGNFWSTGYGMVGPTTKNKINPMLTDFSCSANSSDQTSTQSLQEKIKMLQAQVNALLLKLHQTQ